MRIQKRVHFTLKRGASLWLGRTGLLAGLFLMAAHGGVAAFGQQDDSVALTRGAVIFAQRCSKCHGDYGQGRSGIVSIAGPSLQAEHDPGQVMTAVEVGPSHMPQFSYVLSVEEMRDVAQFVTQKLATIPLAGGHIGEGGEMFRMYCATCHRTAVRGGALVFAGTNAPDLKDKSAALIAGAIRWGPGPMPAFPPSTLSDQQVASIVAYIRNVQHPPSPGGSPLGWYGPVAEGFAAWVMVLALVGMAVWIERGGKG